nr:pxa domain protein 1 [Quercus suber]
MSHVEQRPPRHQRQSSRIATLLGSSSRKPDNDKRAISRTADGATIAYIERTLCQKSTNGKFLTGDASGQRPLEERLPPLTSSNEIDIQLYAIIAVILNQVVQSWYNRITPDGDFVAEIVQIIAHCTRGFEERLRHVDLETIRLTSTTAIMVARDASHVLYDPSPSQDRSELVYHSLRPHHAMTPPPLDEASRLAQDENEVAWCRLVVTNIIPLVLPPEDLLNPCLNVLVSEIFSEMIFHNALCGKVTEPWLLWDGVTKLLYALVPSSRPPVDPAPRPSSRLDKFGLLSSATRLSGPTTRSTPQRKVDAIGDAFWMAVQYALLAGTLLRSFLTALIHASSLPARPGGVSGPDSFIKRRHISDDDLENEASSAAGDSRPILSMALWACLCRLTSFEQRMPWLTGVLSLFQWLSLHGPGQICRTNGPIDSHKVPGASTVGHLTLLCANERLHPVIQRLVLVCLSSGMELTADGPATRPTTSGAQPAIVERLGSNGIALHPHTPNRRSPGDWRARGAHADRMAPLRSGSALSVQRCHCSVPLTYIYLLEPVQPATAQSRSSMRRNTPCQNHARHDGSAATRNCCSSLLQADGSRLCCFRHPARKDAPVTTNDAFALASFA